MSDQSKFWDPGPIYKKGKELYEAGDWEAAIACLSEFISQMESKAETEAESSARYRRGNAYSKLGNFDEAIIDYTIAISCDLYFFTAQLDLPAHAHKKFTTQLHECLRLNPECLYIRNNLGKALMAQEKYEAAIDQFSQVILVDPELAFPWNNRGKAHLGNGDKEKSQADFQKAKDLGYDPDVEDPD